MQNIIRLVPTFRQYLQILNENKNIIFLLYTVLCEMWLLMLTFAVWKKFHVIFC